MIIVMHCIFFLLQMHYYITSSLDQLSRNCIFFFDVIDVIFLVFFSLLIDCVGCFLLYVVIIITLLFGLVCFKIVCVVIKSNKIE
jgi:hypothetical protein